MEQLSKQEYDRFTQIRKEKKLTADVQDFVAMLHAKYFKHSFYKPCTCSGKTWQQWISQLNLIYEKGYRDNT